MTGAVQENTVRSVLALSFFEDTQWYAVNYSLAEPQPWGFRSGCAFAVNMCVDAQGETPLARSFCAVSQRKSCSASRTQISACRLGSWPTDLPVQYRYFTSDAKKVSASRLTVRTADISCESCSQFDSLPRTHVYFILFDAKGGMSKLNDYCPVYGSDAAAVEETCTDSASGVAVAEISAAAALSAYGAVHGAQSRCFHSSINAARSDVADAAADTFAPRCMRFRCAGSSTAPTLSLSLDDGASWILCPDAAAPDTSAVRDVVDEETR